MRALKTYAAISIFLSATGVRKGSNACGSQVSVRSTNFRAWN